MEDKYNRYYAHCIIDVSKSMIEEENSYGKFLWARKFNDYKNVLDVGCGRSWFVRARPQNCVGLDSNPIIVNHYQNEGLNIIQGFAYELPFTDNHFDAIFCNYLLEHLSQPEKSLEEFYRVLKPNGYLYISVPSSYMLTKGFFDDWTHIKPYSKIGIKMLAEMIGFVRIQTRYDICKLAHANEQHYGGLFATTRIHRYFGWKAWYSYLRLVEIFGPKNRNMIILEAWK